MAQADPAGSSAPVVVVDTDILSMFAKAEALVLLGCLFGRNRLAATPAIRAEVAVPLQYGYAFPLQALAETAIAPLPDRAWLAHERLQTAGAALGRGELEAIAFCKTESAECAGGHIPLRSALQATIISPAFSAVLFSGRLVLLRIAAGIDDRSEPRVFTTGCLGVEPRSATTSGSACSSRRGRVPIRSGSALTCLWIAEQVGIAQIREQVRQRLLIDERAAVHPRLQQMQLLR